MSHKDVDPFEEFEFRPLTEGLGFHGKNAEAKKAPKLENKMQTSASADLGAPKTEVRMTATSPSVQDLPTLKSPLPRKETKKEGTVAPPPLSKKTEDVLQGLQKKPWDFNDEVATTSRSQQAETTPTVNYDLSAVVLDSMLLIAGFLTCLIVLLMVTKVDLVANLTAADSSPILMASLAGLFVFLTWVYLVVSRVFMGATPGEWVFDQRLGQPEKIGPLRYLGLTVARTTIVIATGLLTLPLISMIAGRDLVGRWLGLELHRT